MGDLAYQYDAAGRRTRLSGSSARANLPAPVASATYDAANELTQWGAATLSYDADGNLSNDGTNLYAWNARNQLVSMGAATFAYDGFSRRTLNGAGTSFLYDGVNPVQELSGSTVTANLLTGGVDQIFTRTDSAGTRNFLSDALGSTLAITDSSGVVQTAYTYEPFGNTTASGATSGNPYQFTGRENDGTGLYYNRARYYDPAIGRFISEDPIGIAGGSINLYSYVGNDPVDLADPTGLTDESNSKFFWDWALGQGPRIRNYGPNDIETQEMESSVGVNNLRQYFYSKNSQNVTDYGYGTFRAAWDTLLYPLTADWFSTAAQVGAWGPASATNNGDGTVTFSIHNKAGTNSFFYHLVPDRSSPTGWGSNIYQNFKWTEPIPTTGRSCGRP